MTYLTSPTPPKKIKMYLSIERITTTYTTMVVMFTLLDMNQLLKYEFSLNFIYVHFQWQQMSLVLYSPSPAYDHLIIHVQTN